MRYFFTVLLLTLPAPQMLVANDQLPVCFHAASDQDGDGFGFEDGSSCLVDQTTRDLTEPNVCIDEDGDGYGWDGVDTCRVDIVPIAGCEDTDPVGDGWGWDGNQSCRVVPQIPTVKSELELLKEKLISVDNRDRKVAIFYCPSTDETVRLYIYGVLEWYLGQTLERTGMWSTGMYDKDGLVHTRIFEQITFFQGEHRVAFRFTDTGVVFGTSTLCNWITE